LITGIESNGILQFNLGVNTYKGIVMNTRLTCCISGYKTKCWHQIEWSCDRSPDGNDTHPGGAIHVHIS